MTANCESDLREEFGNMLKKFYYRKCRLISEKLTADNLDILYVNLNKKWEAYNKKKPYLSQGKIIKIILEISFEGF